jgi:hypothetical protein
MKVNRGDFSFIPNIMKRAMYQDAFLAIERIPGGWAALERPKVPFITDTVLKQISDEIDKDGKIGHNGTSFQATLRVMERIAKEGWEAFVQRERRLINS